MTTTRELYRQEGSTKRVIAVAIDASRESHARAALGLRPATHGGA